ncbi:T9SS type A sorting domain-containing protein [bacterium]|nr:T9SS type A sorting domain-containing protein [bacterium]
MKKLLLIYLTLISFCVNSQTFPDTVAYDSMESFDWSGNWWVGASTTGFFTNASKSSPASAVIYGTGNSNDEYDWYSLPNIDTLDPNQEYKVQLNIGSYRFTGTGPTSGVDVGDYVDVQVSTDGGLTYNSEIRVTGFNNAYWDFNSKTISKVINGNVDIYTPAGGGDRTLLGDGYSVIELIFPLGTRQIAIDVLVVVDRAGEEWWMDDFFMLGSGSGASLPIKLISFGVGTDDLNQVIIEWSTASQINNDYFTIQKSLNTLEWEDVKEIPGAGNSNTQIDYRSIDTDPYIGLSYYRLKQTDYDGVFETFNPKSVLVKDDMTIGLNIKPNPAISQIELDLVHPNPNYHPYNHDVRIYNTNGEEVYKMYFMGNLNDFIIDVSKFKSGYYLVKSKSDEVKGVGKFMKK